MAIPRRYETQIVLARLLEKHEKLAVRIGRLSVLFEDLRIESIMARRSEGIPWLDKLGKPYRYMYFVRRMALTLCEFHGALQRLGECETWRALLVKQPSDVRDRFAAAAGAIGRLDVRLRPVRDGIGGHVLEKAIGTAMGRVPRDTESVVALMVDDGIESADVRLEYALEIVANAMRVGLAKPESAAEELPAQFNEFFHLLLDGEQQAVKAMHSVSVTVASALFGTFKEVPVAAGDAEDGDSTVKGTR